MRKICLLAALAALYGCGRIDRTPIVPMDTAPPINRDSSATSAAATLPPARPAQPPSDADTGASRGDYSDPGAGGRWRGDPSAAIREVNGQLEDIHFGYDQFELSPAANDALHRDADLLREILREFPQLQVTVEGHCDERGSAEYNLGLGDRRATRTIASLAQLGLPAGNFSAVSYGKEAPQCMESNEGCWSRNRRAHFVVRTRQTE